MDLYRVGHYVDSLLHAVYLQKYVCIVDTMQTGFGDSTRLQWQYNNQTCVIIPIGKEERTFQGLIY